MTGYAAVVLYFRAGPVLGRTVDALLAQTTTPEEILVVDNASGDGVAAEVVRERAGVTLLQLDTNEGYAGGMNRGAEALRSDAPLVLFLTHETAFQPSALAAMLRAAEDHRAVGCGPLLERHRDGSVWSAGGTLSPLGATGHLTSPPGGTDAPYPVDWLDGAAMLLSRAAFREIGGFDERYFLYWEDVDVCVRLREVGPVVCVPAATAAQEAGTTPPYIAARNRIRCCRARAARTRALRAVRGEVWAAFREFVRRRPRPRDGVGRLLGVADGVSGRLRPSLARLRSATD